MAGLRDVGRGGGRELDEFVDVLLENDFFRSVLVQESPSFVLDIAGGNGILSRTLANRGVTGLCLVDPKGLLPLGAGDDLDFDVAAARFKLPREDGDPWWSGGTGRTLGEGRPLDEVFGDVRCILGFRPCEATRAVVEYARRTRTPFALVPCCAVAPWKTLPSTLNGLRQSAGESITTTRLASGQRFIYATTWDEESTSGASRRRRRAAPAPPSAMYRLG